MDPNARFPYWVEAENNYLVCPHCGEYGAYPIDFEWLCSNCGRSYPTETFKCRIEDCWGHAFVGKEHLCDYHTDRLRKIRLKAGLTEDDRWEDDGGPSKLS